jgi:membrane protein
MRLKQTWKLLKDSFNAWLDDYAPSMGAALAYYTMFSIAPLLLIVIAVAGMFFGQEAVSGAIFAQLSDLMGEEGAKTIQDMLASVSRPEEGVTATIIGVVVLLIGATTVFNELQDDLDRIWRAPAREGGGLWKFLRARLLSFGMILGIAFLMVVSLVMSAALATLGKWWGGVFGGWEVLAHALDLLVSFALITGVFAMIYKFLPRVKIRWHDVWIGAAVTAALFTIGKFLIGLYLGKSDIGSGFGAAGSLALVMVWVYYSAQIFLFGAEFTRIYSHAYGSRQDEVQQAADGSRTGAAPRPGEPQPARSGQARPVPPASDRGVRPA